MPRRNRPATVRRRRKSRPQEPATTPITNTDRMAFELYRTGKASAAILGAYKPHLRQEQTP